MSKDDIPQIFYRHYPAYASGNLNVSELARVCELSRNTVYKYIKLVQNS
jgi:predicted DNA-binding transcriptional regulator AlpA